MGFGKRLKTALRLRDITQRELARLLGVGESTVSQWVHELREPDLETQRRIADITNMSLDYFAGRTDDPVGYAPPLAQPERNALADAVEEVQSKEGLTDEEAQELLKYFEVGIRLLRVRKKTTHQDRGADSDS